MRGHLDLALVTRVPAPGSASVDEDVALEVSALYRIAQDRLPARGAICGPSFAGSRAVGGADADLIVGNCLYDIKTRVKPRESLVDDLRQLIGYALLDWDNEYARQAVYVTWPLSPLIAECAGHSSADLGTLRARFRAITSTASARGRRLPRKGTPSDHDLPIHLSSRQRSMDFRAQVAEETSRLAKQQRKVQMRMAEIESQLTGLVTELQGIDGEMAAIVAYESSIAAQPASPAGKPSKTNSPPIRTTRRRRRGSRRAEILSAVASFGSAGASRRDIIRTLSAEGNRSTEQSIGNALAALKMSSAVLHQDGRYVAAPGDLE